MPRALLPEPSLRRQSHRPNVVRCERCGLASIPMLAVPERAQHFYEVLRGHLQLLTAIWRLDANVPAAACARRSARARSVGGTSSASALAVLILITSSNFVGS